MLRTPYPRQNAFFAFCVHNMTKHPFCLSCCQYMVRVFSYFISSFRKRKIPAPLTEIAIMPEYSAIIPKWTARPSHSI